MQAVENSDESKMWRIASMIDKVIHTQITNEFTIVGKPYNLPTIVRGVQRLATLFPYAGMADDRIVDFVVYQVYRYRDMIAEYPHTRWQLSWFFSDNAVAKYKSQFLSEEGKSGMNYYIDQWLREGELDRQMLSDMLADPTQHRLAKFIYQEGEEMTKKRFLNTEMGMMMCLQSTTGWTPKSPTCQQCQYTSRCMEESAKRYPEIIRLRQQCTK